MAGNRTLKLSILADVDDLNKKLKQANNDVEDSAGKLGEFGKKAGAAFAAAAVAAGAFAVKVGIEAVKAASDLSETISKVGVLFGTASKDIEKFASGAAASIGQTKQQALDAAATFATFGKAAGLSGQDLSKFSIDFVKLASDLASFNNTTPEQAINAIGSALRGEAEPLRQYGVLLDDASMRQKALELGIIDNIKNALTPQQKVLAAQALIFEQTGAAQGDFARTSDGLANQTRILTAQLENAKTVIGTALLPIVLELATFIGDKVVPIIEKFAESFGENGNGLGANIKVAGEILSSVFSPILDGLVFAFNVVKKAIDDNKEAFVAFGRIIADYVAPVLGTVLGGALKVVGSIASGVINVIGSVANAIVTVVNGAISAVNALIAAYNKIPILPNIPTIPKTTAPAITVPKISGTGSTGSTTIPKIEMPGGTGASTTSSGGVASAAAAAKAAAEAPIGLQTGSATAKGLSDAQVGGGGTINITVNGALDKEGTARQIVEILNESSYRGGGGSAGALIA